MKAPRGKFLGGKLEGTEGSSTHQPTGAAKASPISRKRIRFSANIERQEKLFADLDEAESLALELLDLASLTAVSLAKAIGAATTEESDFFFLRCESYGDNYSEMVKRIHALLSPHARLVVSYKNHAVDMGKEVSVTQDRRQPASTSLPTTGELSSQASSENVAHTKGKSVGAEIIEKGTKEQSQPTSRVTEAEGLIPTPKNMYAARVELRLAIEKRDVLRELVRLEKEKLNISK